MMRIAVIFLLMMFSTQVNAQSISITVGTGYAACENQLGTDTNGWTIFPDPATITGRIYYVSTTDGNDLNNGLFSTPNFNHVGNNGPVRTINQAVTLLTSFVGGGYPNGNYASESWILLKKGDTFQGTGQSFGYMQVSGVSCQHPMILGSYDPSLPSTLNGQSNLLDPYGNISIASMTCSSGVVSVTTVTPHGWSPGNGTSINVEITGAQAGEYNGEYGGTNAATITGASSFTLPIATCPVSPATTPGIVTVMRPLIEVDSSTSVKSVLYNGGNPVQDYIAIVGLHAYGYKTDPTNPSYDPTEIATATFFVDQNSGWLTWRLLEDNKIDYTLAFTQQFTAQYVTLRRNIAGRFYGNQGNDFYLNGIGFFSAYQNMTWYTNWNPQLSVGQPVTVNTSTSVITWGGSTNILYNSLGTCTLLQFTGSPLPTGISTNTVYFVINIVGTTFQVATSCGGTPITLGGSPASVVGYFQNSQNNRGQSDHDYYLQGHVSLAPHVSINMIGNIVAMASTACECGNGGLYFDNLNVKTLAAWFNGKGSPPAAITNVSYTASYNTFFGSGPTPTTPVPFGTGSAMSAQGPITGPTLIDHNLIANEATITGYASNGKSCGICGSVQLVNQTTISNNISCRIGYNNSPASAIENNNGSPLSYAIQSPGAGLLPKSGTVINGYGDISRLNIPFVNVGAGNGSGLLGWITVDGTAGNITGITFPGSGTSINYKVGDVFSTADNSLIGGVGSGWSATVTSIDGNGGVKGQTIVGGSGYVAPYTSIVPTGGGGALLAPVHLTVSIGPFGCVQGGSPDCVMTGVYRQIFADNWQGYGAGYSIGDLLTIPAASVGGSPGTSPVARVTSIINNIYINNTYQAASCNNLQNGGDQIGLPSWYVPSVAPPLVPSSTPPTDVVGDYFASLPIGYQTIVSGIDNAYSSGYEQGFLKAASLQQKGNWDDRLTAHAVNNWARPQFGMANP